jgi:putative peptidoglycan lipid II flippase
VASCLLGGLLRYADQHIDWLGLHTHSGQRVAWLAACLVGAAVVYFGSLLAMGLRFRQFLRRGS